MKKIIYIVIIGICFVITGCSTTNNFDEAKKLFLSESYYESISKYYEKLNSSQKEEINKMIIDKVGNKTWKSEEIFNHTNYKNCLSSYYVKITNEYVEHYVLCEEQNGENRKEGYEKNSPYFILDEIENGKVQFQVGGIYIIIDSSNNIYLESQSVNSSRNYTLMHHKFIAIE